MKMKKLLCVFVWVFVINLYGDASLSQVKPEEIKFKCIVFKTPILLKSDDSSKLENKINDLPFIVLQKAFWKTSSFDKLLSLYTKKSGSILNKDVFENRFKNKVFSLKYTSYVWCIINGDEIMIAQTLPGKIPNKKIKNLKFFITKGIKKINNEWKFDKTLSQTDLGKIISSTNPKELNKAIVAFFKKQDVK